MAKKPIMDNLEEETILWRDRKRILGMPLSFTVYEVDNDRFTTRKGLFRTETDEILLYRILDIKLVRTFWQKLFGVGTITLYSADQSCGTFAIRNIKKPDAVRKFLSKIVEQQRTLKGITGREIIGAAGMIQGAVDPTSISDTPFVDFDGDGIPD